jgi:integrase
MQETMKRERGSGSLFHNGSNIWWIKFYVRGIAKRESSHSTDLEVAKKLLKRRLAEVETKTYVMRTNVKIDELIADLLAEYRRERRKTITDVEQRWKKHLEPFFGRMKVDDINTDTVQRYGIHRTEKEGAEGPTVNREIAILKHAFNLGLKRTPPKVRTVPVMEMYKESTPRKGFLTDEQYTQLARECNKEGLWLRALLTTAYTFAFRKGELLTLRVRQVDLASRVIQFRRRHNKKR